MAQDIDKSTENTEHKPQRRCICCRSNGMKTGLLRFGVIQNTLCFDLRKKIPGRGYYVCPKLSCIDKAFKGCFKRITKHDSAELAGSAEEFIQTVLIPGLRKRYSECLLAGFRCGQLVCGAEGVEEAAKKNMLACYLLAKDASESTLKKYQTNAGRKSLPCLGLYTASEYGQLLGKSDKTVLGWLNGKLFEEFQQLEMAIMGLVDEAKSRNS